MAVLTTSQLTFYDYKDSYSVEINPDYIIVNCDEKGISKDITKVNISYGVYCGRSRVSGTAVLDLEINGSKIDAAIVNCSSTNDGSIEFTIPANIDFSNIESAHIKFSESVGGDGDTYEFDKYIQFIKAVDGASGTGLIFKIYSENGTVFREDMDQIRLETVVFVGESSLVLDDADYIWEYDAGSNNWEFLGNGPELTVSKEDQHALKTIRCTINYNGNSYQDYISLTDDVVIYTSEVRYFNGSNVIGNSYAQALSDSSNVFGYNNKYIVAYMALYKNGQEIDLLPTYQYAEFQSISDSNTIVTNIIKEDGSSYSTSDTGALVYFIGKVTEGNLLTHRIILGEFDGSTWQIIEPEQVTSYECVYDNSKAYNNLARSVYNASNKIMVVSKEQIDKTLAISFTSYKDGTKVSMANGSIVDTNDPILSAEEPSNPVDGTLWVNIGSTPYTVKICHYNMDGTFEWVDSNQQLGEKLHTSKPTSYNVNDVWVLNTGETCKYGGDSNSTNILPDGYTQLEYLEGTGTQYINTNFTPNQNTRVVCTAIFKVETTTNFMFGARTSSSSNNFSFVGSISSGSYSTQYGAEAKSFSTAYNTSDIFSVDKNKNTTTLIFNNGSTAITTNTSANFTTPGSMFLFACNENGTVKYGRSRIYSCKIYDNGVLIRDFVPCSRNSDGLYGMYDVVNNQFYSNAGSGQFLGATKEKLPDGYTKLQYIESDGTQYIDTGLKANNNTRIEMNCEILSDNSANGESVLTIFGARSSGGVKNFSLIYDLDNDRWSYGYGSTRSYLSSNNPVGKYIIDANKQSCYLNNDTLNNTTSTFSCEYNMYLFALNDTDDAMWMTTGRIYSCKIYNNDVMVRNFIPCKNVNGNVGLYDIINAYFYGNADSDTGSFIDGDVVTELSYEFGAGSMLRATRSRTEEEGFVASDWIDVDPELTKMRENVTQYFEFNSETGLKIGQKDQKFYVNISATEMGFYDNSDAKNPNKKVVSIGNQSATIKNATIEESAAFQCQANFNNQINMCNPYSSSNIGFTWKIEADGSLSLVTIS
jgi:hypothetical protein